MALLAACARMPSAPRNAIPPTVAVSSFENRSGFEGQWQLGGGMADLLVSEMMRTHAFVVVERQHFQGLVQEIVRQKDRLFRPEGKVAEGRMKNAQYLIRGVINDFSQVGGGALSVAFRRVLLGGRGHTARVALTLTIVDVETGEIVSSIQCAGTSAAGQVFGQAEYKGIAFGGDAFFKTPLGKATRDAIRQGVKGILSEMPRTYWKPMIAEVAEDGRLLLNGGRERGFREGQVFIARAPARPVTDPATGDVITFLPGAKVGLLRVTRVEDKITWAEPTEGRGFQRGQWLLESGSDPTTASRGR